MKAPAVCLIVAGALGFVWAVSVTSFWGMMAGLLAVGVGLAIGDGEGW